MPVKSFKDRDRQRGSSPCGQATHPIPGVLRATGAPQLQPQPQADTSPPWGQASQLTPRITQAAQQQAREQLAFSSPRFSFRLKQGSQSNLD